MKKLIIAAGLAASMLSSALAADLPVKARPDLFGPYPEGRCGLYYGVTTIGSAAPIANGPVGATALGGSIGGTIGYTCDRGATFWFAEGIAGFQNLNGGTQGFSMSGPVHLQQRLAFGGPINQLLSLLPNLSFPAVPSIPALPNGVTAGPAKGYIYAALNEDDISVSYLGINSGKAWLVSPELGVGMLTRLSNAVVVDTWAGVKMQSNAICLAGGIQCPKISNGVVVGLSLKY